MNSRLEGGLPAWNDRAELLEELHCCLDEGEISAIYEENDQYVSYEADDCFMAVERRIYFPEAETPESVFSRMVFDDAVLEYIVPGAVADFIYNCVDVNALAAVRAMALFWNEAILGTDGDVEGYESSAARYALEEMVAGAGCDAYAHEVGLVGGEPTLGIVWAERSAVVVNVDAIVSSSKEIAAEYADDYGTSVKMEFPGIFREAFVQTLCHEFRHAVYDLCEFTPFGEDPAYPADGGMEDAVEDYGNMEAANLMANGGARAYVNAMFS